MTDTPTTAPGLELKPCPFECCASTDVSVQLVHDIGGNLTYVGWCQHCGASGPEALSREIAADNWNRRAPSQPAEAPMVPMPSAFTEEELVSLEAGACALEALLSMNRKEPKKLSPEAIATTRVMVNSLRSLAARGKVPK